MFSKWFHAQTALEPSSPLASSRAALAVAASFSSALRPSATPWTRAVTGSAASTCSGMVKHSLQETDLAVAAVVGLGTVETPQLEVPVGGVRTTAEAEVGTGGPAGLDARQILRHPAQTFINFC